MNRFLTRFIFSIVTLAVASVSYAQTPSDMAADIGLPELSVNVIEFEINIKMEFGVPLTNSRVIVSFGTSGWYVAPTLPGDDEKMYVRYGSPDSKEKLAADASAAEANENVGIHGVSVVLRKPPTKGDDFGQTTKKKIEDAGFTITQTGKNKSHYTITLPKPVTQEVADNFNALFAVVTPPKEEVPASNDDTPATTSPVGG